MTPSELVGMRIRAARAAETMSQKQLGEELVRYLGIEWAPQAVSAAEQGRRRFEAAELLALSIVLKQPAAWFLTPGSEDEIEMPSGTVLAGRDLVFGPAAQDPAKQAVDISDWADARSALEEALHELQGVRTAAPSLAAYVRALVRTLGEASGQGVIEEREEI